MRKLPLSDRLYDAYSFFFDQVRETQSQEKREMEEMRDVCYEAMELIKAFEKAESVLSDLSYRLRA